MGEVFAGRYELADPIGRGGVGAVWRAWDHRRRRYVAAKVLQQSDAHTLLRFVREQALRIDHPHVLAPASWAADDDKVLFTMDLVAGGSLVHLVADYGPLPPQFVCVLLDQLLSGVTAVHAEGVVHRDIKPANVLLEASGTGLPHLRLSDFGIAMRKGEPRLTEADYVVGTPGWFAPEQALGAEPDFPADLFAVGLVALYLLEGAKPDAQALIEHFAEHGTPGAPRGVPGPLWGVLAALLQPDPEARFRTATGARKALLSAAELLPEPGPDDELIEVFDQLGPLPSGFSPEGPAVRGRRARPLNAAAGSVPPRPTDDLPGPRPSVSAGAPERAPLTPSSGTDSSAGISDAEAPATPSKPSCPPVVGDVAPELPPVPEHSPEPGDSRMSETGSFPLPPPVPLDEPLPPPPPVPPMPVRSPTVGTPTRDLAQPHAPETPGPAAPRPAVPGPATPGPAAPGRTAPGSSGERHAQAAAEPVVEPAAEANGGSAGGPSLGPFGEPPVGPSAEQGLPPHPQPLVPPGAHPSVEPPAPHSEPVHDRSSRSAPAATGLVPDEEGRHSLYTARVREVPQSEVQSENMSRRERTSRRRNGHGPRRPGPPAAVAVPVLLVAALCFAVGIWALTQA
ncbi:protein kinase [Streptomyces sp. SID5785]|uniref:serine/threonine-protein kinase n=1 Tax=Streptomyces sp. SID5785 TaxID=2690309 RepID=UPI001360F764|nr:serine/threonine-protein kinase [Streptomyces sp. SID5785]MZD06858.1 protein kinase [Streptomyces sp. SID5785]